MGSSLFLYSFAFLCCFCLFLLVDCSSFGQPLCHEEEGSALLQFKRSFVLAKFASNDSFAYPKVASWKMGGNTSEDCCSWDGVECSRRTGHVIGLDLRSSFLYGTFHANSSLFNLVHLRRLNLAGNHFNFSQIPPAIGQLSRLKSLNLSFSSFYGQIPSEISGLSLLTSLDLSGFDLPHGRVLTLQNPNLPNLVKNLTKLRELYLTGIYMPYKIPDTLANMTSLTALGLSRCGLLGEFPRGIFFLPNLKILRAGLNDLNGTLPEFPSGSRLEVLKLYQTSFRGQIPDSIGRLQSLNYLDLSQSNYSGTLPSSLGNLTSLTVLDLTRNKFTGQVPSSLANLSQLTTLALGYNNFDEGTLPWPSGKLLKLNVFYVPAMNLIGEIPLLTANMTELSYLVTSENKIGGKLPSWLMNLTTLTNLALWKNRHHGTIPSAISQLKNLDRLDLAENSFTGTIELDIFMRLGNLASLQLQMNNLTVVNKISTNSSTLPKFNLLGLESCGLTEFPSFMRFQNELKVLFFSNNKIHGPIPTWLWNSSKETLEFVDFSCNFLTGFEQHPSLIPWPNVKFLDLNSNMLQGPLPVPPPSTVIYKVKNNLLTGGIPPSMCRKNALLLFDVSDNKLQGPLPVPPPSTIIYKVNNNLLTGGIPLSMCRKNALRLLDVSDNNINGTIPLCLATFSEDLLVLNLSRNSLQGSIPYTFTANSKLMMLDLGHNQLEGTVPRSLANCTTLEILVLENNRIEDTFPSWLGAIPKLQVLVLRSNRFHGAIEDQTNSMKTNFTFPKLRIVDLSSNNFSSDLPSEYFHNWKAMKMERGEKLAYMHAVRMIRFELSHGTYFWTMSIYYNYSITISSKGTKRLYENIQSVLVVVDLSNNKFSGEIPDSLGSLNGLQVLNISNNHLSGVLPSSLANLTKLESLDLSRNLLSGEIPQELTQLTFLAILNLSHNRLSGPIPRGKQFGTFDNSSYQGNVGLCGEPLSKLCGNSEPSPPLPPPPVPTSQGDDDSEFPKGIYWMVISMGYGSGLIVGLVVGTSLTRRYHEWFVETFGRRKKTQKRQRRKGRRN